ncbi:hypothetical protein VP01_3409g2 [Puccinia sorghi]|uniref:Uncharacterized protein n=1 Tax=Puccinia sorghi TaxID=27349 RepID=A0A0L6UWJ9_9BASI|nr:hypothetical protein VP01_3409g2 [Puccinia sorghi]
MVPKFKQSGTVKLDATLLTKWKRAIVGRAGSRSPLPTNTFLFHHAILTKILLSKWKAFNKQPQASKAPICFCIAPFTRTLLELNLKTPLEKWMKPPSPRNLLTASNLPASILLNPIKNVPPSATSKVKEKIPSIYHTLFIHSLNLSNFPDLKGIDFSKKSKKNEGKNETKRDNTLKGTGTQLMRDE